MLPLRRLEALIDKICFREIIETGRNFNERSLETRLTSLGLLEERKGK